MLTMTSVASLLLQLLVNWWAGPIFSSGLIWAWGAVVGALFIYTLISLALEKALPTPIW